MLPERAATGVVWVKVTVMCLGAAAVLERQNVSL